MATLTLSEALAELHADTTQFYRRCDIYEANNTTIYRLDAPIVDGTVSLDQTRDERRTCDLALHNDEAGDLTPGVGGLWYDKIFRVFMGVIDSVGDTYEWQLGAFKADTIQTATYSDQVTCSLRDFTKMMQSSKLPADTAFPVNTPIENIVDSFAGSAGIVSTDLPLTGISTEILYSFSADTDRWAASKQVANDHAYDLYFDEVGTLQMTVFPDPYLEAPVYAFETGVPVETPSEYKAVRVPLTDETGNNYIQQDTGLLRMSDYDGETLVNRCRFNMFHHSPVGGSGGWDAGEGSWLRGADSTTNRFQYVGGRVRVMHDGVGLADIEVSGAVDSINDLFTDNTDPAEADRPIWVRCAMNHGLTVAEMQYSFDDTQNPDLVNWIEFTGLTTAGADTGWRALTDLNTQLFKANPATSNSDGAGDLLYFDERTGTGEWLLRFDAAEFDAADIVDTNTVTDSVTNIEWTVNAATAADLFHVSHVPQAVRDTNPPSSGGNLVSLGKRINDSRIRNHIVVVGEALNQVPVWAEVANENMASPTNVTDLGYRTERRQSAYITSSSQALNLANQILKFSALESYEVDFGALIHPGLTVGTVVDVIDPEAGGGDPTEYLLSRMSIPLGLSAMTGEVRRVTQIDPTGGASNTYDGGSVAQWTVSTWAGTGPWEDDITGRILHRGAGQGGITTRGYWLPDLVANQYVSLVDQLPLSDTTLVIAVRGIFDYDSGGNASILSTNPASTGFDLRTTSTGALSCNIYADTAAVWSTPAITLATHGLSIGDAYSVRGTLDVSAETFVWDIGTTFSDLVEEETDTMGTIPGGATGVGNGTGEFYVGSRGDSVNPGRSRVDECYVISDGTYIVRPDFAGQPVAVGEFNDNYGVVWTEETTTDGAMPTLTAEKMVFDGGDYWRIDHESSYPDILGAADQDFTIVLPFQWSETYSADETLLEVGDGTVDPRMMLQIVSGTSLEFTCLANTGTPSDVITLSTLSFDDGATYVMILRRQYGTEWEFSFDGVTDTDTTTDDVGSGTTTWNTVTMGADYALSGNFTGNVVDKFRIFDRVLTDTEVTDLVALIKAAYP